MNLNKSHTFMIIRIVILAYYIQKEAKLYKPITKNKY